MALEPLAIGESDGDIFSCPVCARPLAHGAGRCPGCGTRLLLGLPAGRASLFVAMGVVAGMFVGGIVMTGIVMTNRPAELAVAPIAVPAVVLPAAPPNPAATGAPVGPATAPVPAMARSALGQAATLHVRFATAGTSLGVYLGAEDLDTSAIARVLRSIAADAANGSSLTTRIAAWDDADDLSAELQTFYGSLRQAARDGLKASISNERAYREAGEAMVAVLAGLGPVDALTRSLAADADVDLPPPAETVATTIR